MTTTVHLPPALLERIDQRARRLKISRNQYVRRALERMIEAETGWSDEFLAALETAHDDRDGQQAADDMMRAISRRSRKAPLKL